MERYMTLTSFLRTVEFVTFFAATSTVLYFSFAAYRRTRLRAFAFWIWACTIGLIQMSAWYIHIHTPPSSHADEMTFNVIYRLCYLVVTILGAIGNVMLIQHLLKMPPNKSMQSTAAAPASCD